MNSQSKYGFPFGVSYAPYAKSKDLPMSEWERDFQTMKQLNLNTLRGFVAWDRIEISDGVYDDTKLDYLFELAERFGMDIILNVGGAFSNLCGIYPPHWLGLSGECTEVVKLDHSSFYGPRRFLCMDDPVYQQRAFHFIERIVRRYKDHPRLAAWSVWNEPLIGHVCCCRHTMNLFHGYLKKKYHNNLEELNRGWGTEFPISYRSWEEIEPGIEAGFGGGYTACLDWKNFIEEKITNMVRTENKLIKSLDPVHPTTINIVTHAETDRFYRNNLHALAQSVDIAGYSHYLLDDKPYQAAMSLDRLRCATLADRGQFNILETEAGSHQYLHPWLQASGEGECRIKNHWQSVAHGARMILLWKFSGRISDKQTDEYNLTAWDGSITDRARRNAVCAENLNSIADLLSERELHAEIAIFTPHATRMYVEMDTGTSFLMDRYTQSIEGAYKYFWDRNLPVDFLCEQDLTDGRLKNSRYRFLVIPFGVVIDPESANSIDSFVRNGGVVFADCGCGMQTMECCNQRRAPGYGLAALFGGYFNDLLSRLGHPREKVLFGETELPVTDAFAYLYPDSDTEILGRFVHGEAALTGHRAGKGYAVLCGISPFQSYCRNQTAGIPELMNFLLEKAGVKPAFEFRNDSPEAEVEVCELSLAEKSAPRCFVVINHRDEACSGVFVPLGHVPEKLHELRTGELLNLRNGVCHLELSPMQTMILMEE